MRSSSITLAAVLAAASVLTGCAPAYRFTATSAAHPPKPLSCDIQVVAAMPSEGYEEIGVFEFDGFAPTGAISAFKQSVAPRACAAGGDLVVTEVNGAGNIVRGVVFAKKRERAAAERATAL